MYKQDGLSRRDFVATLAKGATLLTFMRMGAVYAADLPHLTSDDGMAKSLGYVDDASHVDTAKMTAYKAGSHCSGCALFQGAKSADWGPCATFPGKSVNKNGWCMAYAAKG